MCTPFFVVANIQIRSDSFQTEQPQIHNCSGNNRRVKALSDWWSVQNHIIATVSGT